MRLRTRLRNALAVAAAAAAALGLAAVVTAPARAAGAACSAAYSVPSDWGAGFTTSVTVTNTGTTAITGWTVTWTFPGNQALQQGWSGTWSQSGPAVTVTNESWNGGLAAGASTQLGANFAYSGSNAAPSSVTCTPAGGTTGPPPGAAPQLHVSGNELVDASGSQVVLHGVNRSGPEYACVQGNGIFDGPDDQASITAIKSWGPVNAVRVPLNEACWNGESYVNAAYAGTNYIDAIKSYVSLLNSNGLVAILDLHWSDGTYTGTSSACSSAQATCQKPMPDAAQAVPFWTSVADTFKGNDAVVFDLFNEPYASRATGDTTSGWQCWENGGTCGGISYQVAGMQQLVTAVRAAGADNVLMLGGEEYSNDLTGWLQHEPADPDHNLAASFHSYNFNSCSSQSCWTSQVAPVIAAVPVVAGEIGENDCGGAYIDSLTAWLESRSTSFLAWTWDNWPGGCSSGPTLITDYTGSPTNYGAAYKAILEALP